MSIQIEIEDHENEIKEELPNLNQKKQNAAKHNIKKINKIKLKYF
ncbi:hypothetical protein [Borreliella lusitaniae]|nr:hypothetical protein [Borreliella lusitaniae]WNY67342.1 hypothetical protein QIA40_04995 [Borreliella lusitaniae]